MKQLTKIKILGVIMVATVFASCNKDLNQVPIVGYVAATAYTTPTAYAEGAAKVYAGFAVTGQVGPSGSPDIQSIDEGSSDYIRSYWSMQEYPTDEAVNHWFNPGPGEYLYHTFGWSSSNTNLLQGMYERIYFEVAVANEYIRQSSDALITSKGFAPADVANIRYFRNEVRFLRALSYWHALDLYGSVPLITENQLPGSFLPRQVSRDSLFNYIQSELLDLSNNNLLVAAGQNQYGRADEGAVWTLLAKLYLNAKVYTGTDMSTNCLVYCNKIINSGAYSLAAKYANLFVPDSHTTSASEIIFPIRMNGALTQSYGCTNFIIHAEVGPLMPLDTFGISSAWGGITTTSALVDSFNVGDQRAMFWTSGQTENIPAITPNVFTYGYAVTKFRNVTSTGSRPDSTLDYVSTDYPMFRLADVYLMYAESVLRGGTGGDMPTALSYFNALRTRAYGNTNGNVAGIGLNDILSERARELYWEGTRRTDLIRFNEFTTASYLWPWKGGSASGTSVDAHYNLYPIPSSEFATNATLVQTPGYTN
jgi:hypothetical protein